MTSGPRIAVIGLGLMGGSLARDLAAAGREVLGYDARPDAGQAAVDAGIIRRLLDSSFAGLDTASIVVIATPVDRAEGILERVTSAAATDAVITDVGSTKAAIVDRAEALGIGRRFVGAHPLAGDHRSGWDAARQKLYHGATVFLCPGPSTSPDARQTIQALWEGVGASCITLQPEEHDRRMAWLSHLPQIASSALATTLAAAGFQPGQLGPGGRDATRLAASSPEMWQAIALSNADHLRAAVESLRERLGELQASLEGRDADELLRFFRRAQAWSTPEA
jgi:prephenate dehydrogenase